MSILLRKACQDALDANKLPMLHVGIANKCLTLNGECGQQLIQISGIQFLASQPKVKEIGYAIELFNKFLTKHAESIQTYLSKKKAFSELPEPTYNNDKYTNNYNGNISLRSVNNYILFNADGTFKINGTWASIADIQAHYDEHYPIVKPYLDAKNAYTIAQTELNKLSKSITSCDI